MNKKNGYQFGISVETNDRTGEVMAVYFQIRGGKSHEVKEHENGSLLADYDRQGRLLGIEMLGPCRANVLDKIAADATVKKFVKKGIPRGMLVSA
jgi:hypothetical protein